MSAKTFVLFVLVYYLLNPPPLVLHDLNIVPMVVPPVWDESVFRAFTVHLLAFTNYEASRPFVHNPFFVALSYS